MLPLALALSPAFAADLPLDVTLQEVFAPDEDASIYLADFAVTADGTVHVLVGSNEVNEVWYTNDAEGAWSSYVVAFGKDGSGPSNLEMGVDGLGRVRAVFDPGPGDVLGLALRDDAGVWSVQNLANAARWFRVSFAAEEVFHVAYSTGGLTYGTNAGGTFATEIVRSSGVYEEREPVLVDAGEAVPAVGFVDRSDFSNPTVQLGRKVEGAWTFETVSEDGAGPLGMVSAADGALHAVFGRDDGAGNLTWVHAVDPGTGWTEAPVLSFDRSGVWDGSPLDLAVLGEQLVWADAAGGLRFIVGQPGAWRSYVADEALDVRRVRLDVVGDRLLALIVGDEDNAVYLVELDVADADADGLPNAFDGCPDDAAKVEPGVCGCGVEEADPCATDDTDDTEVDSDDTDGTDDAPDGDCGCATSGAGGGAALAGLMGLALRWRRRR